MAFATRLSLKFRLVSGHNLNSSGRLSLTCWHRVDPIAISVSDRHSSKKNFLATTLAYVEQFRYKGKHRINPYGDSMAKITQNQFGKGKRLSKLQLNCGTEKKRVEFARPESAAAGKPFECSRPPHATRI